MGNRLVDVLILLLPEIALVAESPSLMIVIQLRLVTGRLKRLVTRPNISQNVVRLLILAALTAGSPQELLS